MKKALIIEVEEKNSELTALTLRSIGTDNVLIKLEGPGASVSITELKAALDSMEEWQEKEDSKEIPY
jgi:hypothetical protein